MNEQEVMNAYRAELRRLYGDEVADKTELHYARGWYYLNIARKFRDGSVGTLGKADAMRGSWLVKMTENLRTRKEGP